MPPTPSGMISEPKQALRELLAECASWRAFLGVGGDQAAARAKTYSDFVFGSETLQLARPFAILMFPRIRLTKIGTGGMHHLWPQVRQIDVQMFCNDPGSPKVVQGKVPIVEIETGTMTLENFIGNLFEEMRQLAAVEDRLAIDSLDWSQNWVRTNPDTWPSEPSQCYSFFSVGFEW
jgi:hypothetical protein